MEQIITAKVYIKDMHKIGHFIEKHPNMPNGEKTLIRDVVRIAVEYADAHGVLK
jgi:hypothetical protein